MGRRAGGGCSRRPGCSWCLPRAPRKRRTEDPGVPAQHLFEEIKALGFTGCLNLLHKYINQGRADADRSHISPRRLARMILTRPDNLKTEYRDLLARLTAACPPALR
ncbi:hypothetical protein RKD30_004876 [Streptomyces pristinaespiralis]